MRRQQNLADIISVDPKFGILAKALRATSLFDLLRTEGALTLLAPTNLAFTRLPELRLISLMQPRESHRLKEILRNHLIAGLIRPNEMGKLGCAETLTGQTIEIEAAGELLKVNGINLHPTSVEGTNGVLYPLSTLLIPTVVEAGATFVYGNPQANSSAQLKRNQQR